MELVAAEPLGYGLVALALVIDDKAIPDLRNHLVEIVGDLPPLRKTQYLLCHARPPFKIAAILALMAGSHGVAMMMMRSMWMRGFPQRLRATASGSI